MKWHQWLSVLALIAACGRVGYAEQDAPIAADGAPDIAIDAAGGDPLAALDDEFDDGVLRPAWETSNPGLGTVVESDGALVLRPTSTGQWFENNAGMFVWQPLSGDFVMTARVTLTDSSMPPAAPAGPGLEVSSIMVRHPSSRDGARNHSWVGVVSEGGVPGKESKNTINSASDYTIDPISESRGQVRMCRIGPTLRTYHAPYDGGSWQLHRTFDRPDLPAAVQVGVTATENANPADIIATFDWLRFRTPTSEADCTAL